MVMPQPNSLVVELNFFLIIGTVIHISLIAYYKYANFFLSPVGSLFAAK
jgi:hypothetical protein